MAASTSLLSFSHSSLAASSSYAAQQISVPPKFVTLRPQNLPLIQAKAHTRREDRTARHVRVRKKVYISSFSFKLLVYIVFDYI